LVSFR